MALLISFTKILVLSASILTASASPAPSPTEPNSLDIRAALPFNSNTWYRLTNLFLGPTHSLDVVNDAGTSSSGILQIAATGIYSGQYWQLLPSFDGSTYTLVTQFLGQDMRLDVLNTSPYKTPHLATISNAKTQKWTFKAWGDGTWSIGNGGVLLDTYSDQQNAPFLEGGNHSGQHWDITAIGPIN